MSFLFLIDLPQKNQRRGPRAFVKLRSFRDLQPAGGRAEHGVPKPKKCRAQITLFNKKIFISPSFSVKSFLKRYVGPIYTFTHRPSDRYTVLSRPIYNISTCPGLNYLNLIRKSRFFQKLSMVFKTPLPKRGFF